jgi:predicted dehydrogenase
MNQNEPNNGVNRRDFLRGGSLATLMTMLGGVELIAQTATPAADAKPAGSKVKLAVIGCGAWGREILKTLGSLPLAEVVAICDTYPSAMRKCAGDAPGAKQVADYKAVLEDKAVQAVFIATPTHQRLDVVLAAIKAGKHVYCEAPLAHTLEDAKAIALAAKAATKQIFQAGLQMRSDAQRHFLLPFIRSGALGPFIMGRAQWHKKQSWRSASPNPDREKALNWRLDRKTSHGLMGEIGIHQLDQAGWFLNARPVAVTGFHSLVKWNDGRDVPETIQAVFEFPKQVQFVYHATLANSFDADYEIYYGSDAAVMMRENKAWMFKEVDSPLLGWEVYAKKEQFYRETGIALVAGASKQEKLLEKQGDAVALENTPIYQSLRNFLANVFDQDAAIQNFVDSYGADDEAALMAELEKTTIPRRKPGASALEGFQATVTAIKANEAILSGQRLEFKDEWYQLS